MPIESTGSDKKTHPELLSVDTDTGEPHSVALPAPGRGWFTTDDEMFRYLLLDKGVVRVSSSGELTDAPIKSGDDNAYFLGNPEGSRFFLAGRTKKQGFLTLIAAGKPVKAINVPVARAMTLDKSGQRLFYLAENEGIILDSQTLNELGRFSVSVAAMEARLDPAEKRLYANGYGGKVAVIDVETRKEVASFSAGRGGVKFGRLLAAAVSDTLADMQYSYSPYRPYRPSTMPVEIKTLAFAPSGKFVYVYSDLSSDVTVVDTATFAVLAKEPTGSVDRSQFIWQSADGLHLFVNAQKKLSVFDTETGKVVGRPEIEKGRIRYAPDLDRVLTMTPSRTIVSLPVTYEAIKELPPAEDAIVISDAKRFALVSSSAVRLYDFDLMPRGVAEGQFKP